MAEYKHGAYGEYHTTGDKVTAKSRSAIVYVGTAPVQTVEGGAANVNKPILVKTIGEAKRYLGYSDDWSKYTLCEAMRAHLENEAVAPLIFINVLDPAAHKADSGGNASLTPANGRVVITNAEDAVLDSIAVADKVKGKDYTVAYSNGTIIIAEAAPGALGTEALTITYDKVDASKVDAVDVIGASDGLGLNTGIHAIKNVYQETQHIPAYLLAPGFSSIPKVHTAMLHNAKKINSHWDAYVMADLPIVDQEGEAVTMANVAAWKAANGYNDIGETVYYPLVKANDGKTYHISVLAAANFQALLAENEGVPYKTASNTECSIIRSLYTGEGDAKRVYDDEIINEKLNKNGIASAAYVGGRWVIWGCHGADYTPDTANTVNVSETNRMMMYYISNDFQHRRAIDVDKPMSANDVRMVMAEEQARLDALVKTGALIYGACSVSAEQDVMSDMMKGEYAFSFKVTATPLAKALTAVVSWTDEGYVTYFAEVAAA